MIAVEATYWPPAAGEVSLESLKTTSSLVFLSEWQLQGGLACYTVSQAMYEGLADNGS